MDSPSWNDIYTPQELAAALDCHGLRLARMTGWYDIAQEILHAAQCIRDLGEERDKLRTAGGDLVRQIMASKESLTRTPS